MSKVRAATILESPTNDNGYWWVVLDSNLEKHYLRGIGAPKLDKDSVGDCGTIEFTKLGSGAIWKWVRS